MKHYLLLRDNKQTGPHSFEEILELGMRSHDLIWVDGKSAAWRYPGELPEFKDHAPAAPEQPFDRFFKRPGTEPSAPAETETTGIGTQQVMPTPRLESVPNDETEIPTLTRFMQEQERVRFEFPENEADIPKESSTNPETPGPSGPRYVSVSLPAQDQEKPVVVIGNQGSVSSAPAAKKGGDNRTKEKTDLADEKPARVPVSQMFPERDPSTRPVLRRQRDAQPWIQYAAVVVGMFSLMGLGVLIGMKWSRSGPGDALAKQNTFSSDRPQPAAGGNGIKSLVVPVTDSASLSKSVMVENKLPRKLHKDSNLLTPVLSGAVVTTDLNKEVDPSVLQEEQHKRREAEEKENARTNIARMVDLQAGDYKVGVFGGISDLEVTVSNRSGYPMDQVVVEVNYLLSNKKVYKTETLRFVDLGPHGSKMLTLPHTGRGVKVESHIVRMESRDLDLAWSR